MSDNYKDIISEPLVLDRLKATSSYGLSITDLYEYISKNKRVNELISIGRLYGELNPNFETHNKYVTIGNPSAIIRIHKIYKVNDSIIADYNYLNEEDYYLLKNHKHKLVPRFLYRFNKDENKVDDVSLITIDLRTI